MYMCMFVSIYVFIYGYIYTCIQILWGGEWEEDPPGGTVMI
jgi:hypothetical protein